MENKYAAVLATLTALIAACLGYALDFEPDFSVSLSAQKVYIERPDVENSNTITIKDKCPNWLGVEKWFNMRYDNQIYFTIDEIHNGLIIDFDPPAINSPGDNSNSIINIKIKTTECIKRGTYPVDIVVIGADTKRKFCRMYIDVH